ncbi:MAG: DUF1800 domain-containing protein [Burkholderiales bacterium]|nr:DUF1800 domain-containing protein [Burkholderiales bacterium]
MLLRLATAVLLCLAAASAAGASAPLGYDDARHLLARTGFGPTDAEVRRFAGLTREQAVTQLLRDTRSSAVTPPPLWADDDAALRYPNPQTATVDERRAFRQQQVRQGLELRAWWMTEMLVTSSPLSERMTLFWHNHFVSSQQKVRFARLMYAQNRTLREHALGSFAALLHAASKEPAMLVYLDGAKSRRDQPNENFAREVMELFTLGEGHYSEQDIKEAARAFTGWSVDRDTGRYRYRPFLRDPGVKTVLDRSGRFDGDAVLDIILARPQTAQFIVAKLWREFVSAEPDPEEVARIAQIFRGQDYDIKAALHALLLSNAFWATENRGTLVKSPVELVVGTLRQLEIAPEAAMPFAIVAAGMGQNLFSPPNVRGWPGGIAWINSDTLLARKQFLDRLLRGDGGVPASMRMIATGSAPAPASSGASTSVATDANEAIAASDLDDAKVRARQFALAVDRGLRSVHFDAVRWLARQQGATPTAKMRTAQALLLPLTPPMADAEGDVDARSFVRATLLDPAYQLK